jgi:cell wall-associated NlpC family hydrolase
MSSVCAVLLAALAVSAGAGAAGASPVDEKRAEAERLQREIDANGERISMLAERYNEARLRLDEATANVETVRAQLAAAQREAERIRVLVGKRAAAIYVGAGTASPMRAFELASVNELAVRSKYAESTADRDRALLDRLARSKVELKLAQRRFEDARQRAQQEVDAIEASRREVESANAHQAELLAQVQGEIATLLAEEAARRAAEEKARSDAEMARLQREAEARRAQQASRPQTPGVDPGNVAVPDVPAPSPGAAAAVAYAKAQLGKPYRYAGVGPDAFDCSGLTMMAWAQGGVSMPHGSIAQGQMFPRVPDDAIAPGDLVIYYPDHHHVAIYVGGGMTIAATQTGDYVRLQPVFRSQFQFAVRPG